MLSIMSQNKIFFRGKPAITEVYEKKKKKRFTPQIFNFSIAFQNHLVVYAGDSLENNLYLEL